MERSADIADIKFTNFQLDFDMRGNIRILHSYIPAIIKNYELLRIIMNRREVEISFFFFNKSVTYTISSGSSEVATHVARSSKVYVFVCYLHEHYKNLKPHQPNSF